MDTKTRVVSKKKEQEKIVIDCFSPRHFLPTVEQHGGHEDGHGSGKAELKEPHEHRQSGRHHLREHHPCNLPGEGGAAPWVPIQRLRGWALHPLRVISLQQHIVVSV